MSTCSPCVGQRVFGARFNRRKSRSRGKLFYRLAQQAMQVDPHPYERIVHTRY